VGRGAGCAPAGERAAALRHLERAGDHARAQHAHVAAERAYREALECVDDVAHLQDDARLREKLGALLCATGRYAVALPVLEAAATAYSTAGDAEGLRRVTAQVGRPCSTSGGCCTGPEGNGTWPTTIWRRRARSSNDSVPGERERESIMCSRRSAPLTQQGGKHDGT
jgi:hypothetical protein